MKSIINTLLRSNKSQHYLMNKKHSEKILNSESSRPYTCLKDYVYHISQGNIEGVDPKVIQECPVCSKIYNEMFGITDTICITRKELPPKLWIALWIAYHDSSINEIEDALTNTYDGYSYIA